MRVLVTVGGIAGAGYAATRLLERRTGTPFPELVERFARTARDAAAQREADLREALGMIDENPPAARVDRGRNPRDTASATRAEDAPPGDFPADRSSRSAGDEPPPLTAQEARALLLDPAGRAPSGR